MTGVEEAMTRKEASECLIGGVWVTRWGGLKVGLADNFVHNSMVHPHSPQCVRAPHDSLSITLHDPIYLVEPHPENVFSYGKFFAFFPKKYYLTYATLAVLRG